MIGSIPASFPLLTYFHSPTTCPIGFSITSPALSNLQPLHPPFFYFSRILQEPLPLDWLGEDLSLQPHLVAVVEVLGQIHSLSQNALKTVVHRREVPVLVLVVPPAVELLNALSQRALLSLEVPWPGIDIWQGEERRTFSISFIFPHAQ